MHSNDSSEHIVPAKPPHSSGASPVEEVHEDPDEVVPSTHEHWYVVAIWFDPAAMSPGRLMQTPISPHGQTSSQEPFTPLVIPRTSYKRHRALMVLRVLYVLLLPDPLLRQTVSDWNQGRGVNPWSERWSPPRVNPCWKHKTKAASEHVLKRQASCYNVDDSLTSIAFTDSTTNAVQTSFFNRFRQSMMMFFLFWWYNRFVMIVGSNSIVSLEFCVTEQFCRRWPAWVPGDQSCSTCSR